MDVIIVVTNLMLSIYLATESTVLKDIPLRFVWTSVVLYLVVSLQGSVQAVMSFNRFIHFSDWVIGHSHLAMIGFASFAAMGGLSHLWQCLPGVRQSRRMLAWSYWLIVLGLAFMVIDLTGAGLVQASLWQQHLPWMESVRDSAPYWVARSVSGIVLIAGFVVFGLSFFTGERHAQGEIVVEPVQFVGHSHSSRVVRWIQTAYATTFGAGIVFFVISFLALAVYPAIRLHEQIEKDTPAGAHLALTPSEQRGDVLYAKNGCAYCHSEQVRFTPADGWRFGAPTEAWETQNQYPQMWGTRRIGPDLAREYGKHTADWQLVHLYNPRYIVPGSMMPSFPWFFDETAEKPSQAALDVVAYLNTLGRPAAELHRTKSSAPETAYAHAVELNSMDYAEGRQVFQQNCAGCHGEKADGLSPGAKALRPIGFNLAGFRLQDEVVWRALANGVHGSAMPAWNDLPSDQFRAVASYVQAIGDLGHLDPSKQVAPDPVLMEAGHRIFTTHCERCHGANLDGNGPDASKYLPRPANFHEVAPSYSASSRIMHDGVPGSGMPAWPLLTPEETQAVTFYMRSFYQGDSGRQTTIRQDNNQHGMEGMR
ncbi:MAG: hypothetical protein NVS2B16_35030 [Chloroflexota bacterium]